MLHTRDTTHYLVLDHFFGSTYSRRYTPDVGKPNSTALNLRHNKYHLASSVSFVCGACQMSLVEPSALLSDTPVPPKIYDTLARFLIISLGVPIPGVIRWMWGNQIQFSYPKQVVLAVSIVSLGRHTPQVLSSFVLPTLQCAACACMLLNLQTAPSLSHLKNSACCHITNER